MARWKGCVEVVLCVIQLLFLSLTFEALEGKLCQNSLTSGGGGSIEPRFQGERVVPCQNIDTTRKATNCVQLRR